MSAKNPDGSGKSPGALRSEVRLSRQCPATLFAAALGRRVGDEYLADVRWKRVAVAGPGSSEFRYRVTLGWARLFRPVNAIDRRWQNWAVPRMGWADRLRLARFRLTSRRVPG